MTISDQKVQEALAQLRRTREQEAAERRARYVQSQAVANKLVAPLRDIVTGDKRFQEGQRELRAEIESWRKGLVQLPFPERPGKKPRTVLDDDVTHFPVEMTGANTGDTATVDTSSGHLFVHAPVQDRSGDAWADIGFVWQPPATENTWMQVRIAMDFGFRWGTVTWGPNTATVDGWLDLRVSDIVTQQVVSYSIRKNIFHWVEPWFHPIPTSDDEGQPFQNWTVDGELPLTGFWAVPGHVYLILAECEVATYAGSFSSADAAIGANAHSISIEPH